MLSSESEVLSRHLDLFENKNILLFGYMQDQFSRQLNKIAKKVSVFSSYFDFVSQNNQAEFGIRCEIPADLGVFYWSKNKKEGEFQLLQWLSTTKEGQELIIIGENRSGVRSVEKILTKFGNIAKIDSARRCGLYHFELTQVPEFNCKKFWKSYRLLNTDLIIHTLPAVFSSAELDVGTKLLLSTFHKADGLKGKVLDLGCGSGVIGASLKKQFPKIKLTMSDIHAMALSSSERTLKENNLEGNVVASNVFSHIEDRFDLIISNPPFHDGVDTAYTAVETLIMESKKYLNRGGELRIVANAHLPYPDLLDKTFGSHKILAKTNKFKVYSVRS